MNSLFHSKIKALVSIFLIFYLFLFIYSPRLVAFNTSHLIFAFSLPFFIVFYNRCYIVLIQSKLYRFIFLIFFIKTFSIFVAITNNLEPDFYSIWQLCIELPICVAFVIVVMQRFSYKSEDLITILIIIGIIQTFIGVLMIGSPSFKEIVDNHRHQFWDSRYIGLSSWRMFGFSDNLLHITPIVQAFIAFLILLRSSKHLYLTVVIPFFFMLCAVNTRTSAFLFLVLFLIYVLYAPRNRHKYYVLTILFVICVLAASSFLLFVTNNSEQGYDYFITGYEGVVDFIGGGSSNSEVKFSSGYNSIPSDWLTLLVGVGQDVQAGLKYNGQFVDGDMGFVNDLWRYGVVLSLVLWGELVYYASRIKYSKFKNAKLVSKVMIIVFLVSQYKGTTTCYCDYVVLLLVLSSSFLLDKNIMKIRKRITYEKI